MQKIATKVFICTSVAFGVIGLLLVLTGWGPNQQDTTSTRLLFRLLSACIFIILTSFALSVAGKYLNGNGKH